MESTNLNLPHKVLCIVIGVQLKAHVNTDEVFALVTLIPLKQQEFMVEDNHPFDDSPSEVYSFKKMLTSIEDAAGLYIPKEHAERCFPSLDMTVQQPMQDLVVKDLHGIEWNFRHIYCDHKKEHMLTCGWSTFVNSKKLVPGDSCIFVRGENGEIGIGIHRAMKQHSDIWKTSSPLGLMCAASHAVSTGTMFHVQYYPWITPFEFMIPLKTYVESIERDYSIGTRVRRLLSEVEGSPRRYGTIVGNEDIDPIRWPGSEWRCIKVQWDSTPNSFTQLESVCPWWIEPLGSPKIKSFPIPPLSNEVIGSSSTPEYHTVDVDMDMQGRQHYNTRNDENSIFFIFAFSIILCFFTFVIFVFRPLL
ncbi:auxin response factor 2-like [Trifolium pratense]|uniref:auxin response factor 2-like n=1 Tax=Trifolium pratense TaxID=57577 RepID=UPI001E694FE1|nr:auxin response factor 2-like [Trifolium pratense]